MVGLAQNKGISLSFFYVKGIREELQKLQIL